MAENTLNQPHTKHAELFSMEATYLISPDSTVDQLMNDASSMLNGAIAVLESAFEKLDGEIYAALHLIKQAKGMHDEAHSKLVHAGHVEV